ncbi:MAG: hypothetical protein RIR70_1663 [Pseudomonadota bacterium]
MLIGSRGAEPVGYVDMTSDLAEIGITQEGKKLMVPRALEHDVWRAVRVLREEQFLFTGEPVDVTGRSSSIIAALGNLVAMGAIRLEIQRRLPGAAVEQLRQRQQAREIPRPPTEPAQIAEDGVNRPIEEAVAKTFYRNCAFLPQNFWAAGLLCAAGIKGWVSLESMMYGAVRLTNPSENKPLVALDMLMPTAFCLLLMIEYVRVNRNEVTLRHEERRNRTSAGSAEQNV